MNKIYKFSIVIVTIFILLICKSYSFGTTLSPAQMEFNVKFSGEPVVSDSNKVVASILDSNNALINVYDLTMEDNKKSITFIVQNTSRDLHANVTMELTNTNKEHFSVESVIEKTQLSNGEATKVTINVELIKEPLIETEVSTIKLKLISEPVQPTYSDGNNGSNDNTNTDTGTGNTPQDNTQNNNFNEKEKDKNVIVEFVDYYKKDETPKTGIFKIIDILRGY